MANQRDIADVSSALKPTLTRLQSEGRDGKDIALGVISALRVFVLEQAGAGRAKKELEELARELSPKSETSHAFLDRHTQMPAKLVFYQLKSGQKSVALCYPWPDLKERALKYVAEWDAMFPDNPLEYVAMQDVEWPE